MHIIHFVGVLCLIARNIICYKLLKPFPMRWASRPLINLSMGLVPDNLAFD